MRMTAFALLAMAVVAILAVFLVMPAGALQNEEKVGVRPYEMEWAGRTQDDHPPLVDFEDLTGWQAVARNGVASFGRTREQQIWGRYVGKLTYRGDGVGPAEVRIVPPKPIPITAAFDAVTLWCYGNNWGWAPDPMTPQVQISALFLDAQGREFAVYLYHVDWTEWYLLHKRLTPEQIARVKEGASFAGLLIAGGRQKEDRVLYFDNLAVYSEQFRPLAFQQRPLRNLTPFPGQDMGANAGPGKLPFPTSEKTILPPVLDPKAVLAAKGDGSGATFSCTDAAGSVEYRYIPKSGTWDDIEAVFRSRSKAVRECRFQPCVGGGALLRTSDGPRLPDQAELIGSEMRDGAFAARWRLTAGGVTAEVTYRFRIWGKSLVMDVLAPGGCIAEVRYGRAVGLRNPRLVTHPFYPADGGRPAMVCFDGPGAPLFLMGNTDWYRTNASTMWAVNAADASGVTYNGGTRYTPLPDPRPQGGRESVGATSSLATEASSPPSPLATRASSPPSPLTTEASSPPSPFTGEGRGGGAPSGPAPSLPWGKVNDCFERFFLTVSPILEETLPSIPNPISPWKTVTGTRVWRAHGAGNRDADKRFWSDIHRYGITEMVVTDHETMWRDGGESFTFRTKAAPGKGGDEGARDYSRFMQDTLGFVYGPYNNFTDFAPVNEYWSTDMIARDPQNQLQHAWMRCYAPKPARAVEYCERLSPVNQAKFGFSTAYCDVHTAVAPWHRVDFDPRAPGAGTMAAVFYAYGEIMLLQKKAWNGPVYSEGNYHGFYCGLTDGNYGQDQSYRPTENPWLVDFDLRRMHDLCCNFGMGNPEMFYANVPQPQATQAERDSWLDRFLTATVAFGHPGFLVTEGGMGNALRSYYMLQQLHSRYCLARAVDIRYVGPGGRLLTSSQAVASGAYRHSQVVTRYSDGTVTVANGSKTERLTTTAWGRKVDLPPNGYAAWTADGSVEVFAGDRQGHRCDYAATPAYIYVDGRGRFQRFARAASDGAAVCRKVRDGEWEIIPLGKAQCGFAITASSATALDKDRAPIGSAEVRASRGLTYVMPVEGAFSYLLKGVKPIAPKNALHAERTIVTPGEEVTVTGRTGHLVSIPHDAAPGSRIWRELEGEWVDFTVTSLAQVRLRLDEEQLHIDLKTALPGAADLEVRAIGRTVRVPTQPGKLSTVSLPLAPAVDETAEVLTIGIAAGKAVQTVEAALRIERVPLIVAAMPDRWSGGMCERGKAEVEGYGGTGAHVQPGRGECNGVARDSLKMHPPWINAVGYVFALFDPVALPPERPAAFRALVGKLDGSDPGDGILYRVMVVDSAGSQTVAGEQTVRQHTWETIEADLSRWAGQKIRLKLVADPGPADNTSGDWACWSDMRIETITPVLHRVLDTDVERYRRAPGPHPAQGLTVAEIRAAVRGWLRYDGKGLNSGAYASLGVLNGVELGELAEAGGDEVAGIWAERVGVPLPPEAIRSLSSRNRFVLKNPRHDWFSIRRIWIELELADGRKCSSDIADVTFTQPQEWPYAEGIRVPFGTDIEVDVWFRL